MLELLLKGQKVIINTGIINRDIAQLEKDGKVGRYKEGVFSAPQPNIHGLLTCLRDKKYNISDIEDFCMKVCPNYDCSNKNGDDAILLCDCKKYLFEALSLDGKTKYIEFL